VTPDRNGQLTDFFSDIGISGRVKHQAPAYVLTLAGRGRGRIAVTVQSNGEPSLVAFAHDLLQHSHVNKFLTPTESHQVRQILG
jgi:hypothetical protein